MKVCGMHKNDITLDQQKSCCCSLL